MSIGEIPLTSLGCAPAVMTVNEVAEYTRLSPKTIWDLISAKCLETTSVGRRRLVHTRSVLTMLEQGTPGSIKKAAADAKNAAAERPKSAVEKVKAIAAEKRAAAEELARTTAARAAAKGKRKIAA